MKLKTSFFNKGIIIDDFKRFGWIGIVYALVLFFIVPLKILMVYSNKEVYLYTINTVIKCLFYLTTGNVQSLLILTVPVLLAIFLFRYMQVKISSDMIHSLPVKRNSLYISHVFVGVLVLIIPVVIIGVISSILNKTLDLGEYYSLYDIWYWVRVTILMDLVFFFTSVFVGMLVGISIMQGLLTYILLLLPFGLMMLLTYNLKVFVYGFMYNIGANEEKFSPIIRTLGGFADISGNINGNIVISNKISIGEVIVYITLCIVLYFLASFVYNKRKLEAASQSIAFKSLQYAFKYGMTFCTMLLIGLYFQQIQKSISWIFFGYFVGSLIGYFTAEMIIKKSIWVFRNIKGYGIYAVVISLLIVGMKIDIIGYENKVPALEQVSSIYFSSEFYDINSEKYKIGVYTDKKNLQNIAAMHSEIIKDKSKNMNTNNKLQKYTIFEYRLNDGSKIQRTYNISDKNYVKYLKPIRESEQYKTIFNDILTADASDIEKITISPQLMGNKKAVIINPVDIKEGVEVLKQDIKNETYEEMEDYKVPWAGVSLMIASDKIKNYPKLNDPKFNGGDRQIHLSWKKSYRLFEEWLKKKGYLEDSRVLPRDIDYAIVQKLKNQQESDGRLNKEISIDENNKNNLKITDKDQIEACLRNYQYSKMGNDERYAIGFYGSNNIVKQEIQVFDENTVPDFIKSYLNK